MIDDWQASLAITAGIARLSPAKRFTEEAMADLRSRCRRSHDRAAHRQRDYSLLGRTRSSRSRTGSKAAEWYHTDIPRKEMKALMQRADQPAIRDTILWIGVDAGLRRHRDRALAAATRGCRSRSGSPTACSTARPSDSRWHECGHGTAFKTPWMNDVVYQIACFMIIREPVRLAWSHTRHHTDTIIVGLDPEIALMRPPALLQADPRTSSALIDIWNGLGRMFYNATGRHPPGGGDLHPRDRNGPRSSAPPASGSRSTPRPLALAIWTQLDPAVPA